MQHTLPIAVNQVDVTINQDIKALIIKDKSQLNPYYLAYYFNTFQKRILPLIVKHGTIVQSVNTEQFDKLPIPIPPIEIQKQIVKKFETAYQAKREKEAEAKELLAGIDAYLLDKLGIKSPTTDQPPQKTFFTTLSKVTGNRFDSFYHQLKFENNQRLIKTSKYKVKTLKQIIEKLIKGKLPKEEEKNGNYKVVQINSIDENGYIDTDNLLMAKGIFTKEQQLFFNDVLVVITGATIGKIAIWENEASDYYLGGDIVKFQCLNDVNPYFIFSWLRSINSQLEIKRNITGATNGHLSPYDVENILIPLPPLEVQEEIADHIQNIRERAKKLETEAKAEIERAKAEVEAMILGK